MAKVVCSQQAGGRKKKAEYLNIQSKAAALQCNVSVSSSNSDSTRAKFTFTMKRGTRMQQAVVLPVRKTILAQKGEQLVSRHMYGVSWKVRANYPFTSWANA